MNKIEMVLTLKATSRNICTYARKAADGPRPVTVHVRKSELPDPAPLLLTVTLERSD